jgi:Tol biopolymer transport system component
MIAFNGLVPRSRNTDGYVMNAYGSDIRQLTDSPGFDENPAWSPDGGQLVFQAQRDGDFELYLMQTDGSQQRPLTISAADELWPSWGKSTPVLFEKSEQELSLGETCQAALGDLDGDGDLDSVFANPMSNHAGVWLNDGNGFFTDTGQQLTQYGHG